MHSPFYFTIAVAALCGLWFLWDVALKNLFLDVFREAIFKLRFDLFELGMSGAVPFSSEVYRTMETLLNGLLRYGHRFTFMSFVFSLGEQQKAKRDKNYVDLAAQISLQMSRVNPDSQKMLKQILDRVNTLVILYMAVTSLLFILTSCIAQILRLMRIVRFSSRRDVGLVLEREAFREMQNEPRLVAA